MGGNLNAYTTREYTSYIMQVEKDKLDWAIELLSDITLNS
jgi:predicted Zn-dependent peptidase